MIAISINSVILKINFGWSNKIKNTKGKNITNLFNWLIAQGSRLPPAAEYKLISPIQKIISKRKKYIQLILRSDLKSLNIFLIGKI